jgi:Uma2 family endonuclease
VPGGNNYVPDVVVIPAAFASFRRGGGRGFDGYSQPMPLVIEVWSPSTGAYDVGAKSPGYQERGDQEIWLVHPYDVTLTRWLIQVDGTYRQSMHRPPEVLVPVALPAVRVALDDIFAP